MRRNGSGLCVALLLLLALPVWADEDSWTGVERVVAVGDVHGDHDQLLAILRSAGLVDAKGDWSGGKAHFVQTGDVLDRGPDSRKAMDLLMKLEAQALEAGGRVHCLIGNHEAMVLYGDLRYVAPGEIEAFKDANSAKARDDYYLEHQKKLRETLPAERLPKFDATYRASWDAEHPLGFAEFRRAFEPAGTYGKWIRRHNAVIRIDGMLFLHGGISPKYATGWTIRQINERIRAELDDFTKLPGGVVMDEEGPLWYRGLAQGDEKTLEAHLRALLASYGVERVAVGHTFTEGAILPRFGGRVLQIDIGLSRVYDRKGRVACLLIEKGAPAALHRGKRLELPADAGADLLRYLKEAVALDPKPSPLMRRLAETEMRLSEK